MFPNVSLSLGNLWTAGTVLGVLLFVGGIAAPFSHDWDYEREREQFDSQAAALQSEIFALDQAEGQSLDLVHKPDMVKFFFDSNGKPLPGNTPAPPELLSRINEFDARQAENEKTRATLVAKARKQVADRQSLRVNALETLTIQRYSWWARVCGSALAIIFGALWFISQRQQDARAAGLALPSFQIGAGRSAILFAGLITTLVSLFAPDYLRIYDQSYWNILENQLYAACQPFFPDLQAEMDDAYLTAARNFGKENTASDDGRLDSIEKTFRELPSRHPDLKAACDRGLAYFENRHSFYGGRPARAFMIANAHYGCWAGVGMVLFALFGMPALSYGRRRLSKAHLPRVKNKPEPIAIGTAADAVDGKPRHTEPEAGTL